MWRRGRRSYAIAPREKPFEGHGGEGHNDEKEVAPGQGVGPVVAAAEQGDAAYGCQGPDECVLPGTGRLPCDQQEAGCE